MLSTNSLLNDFGPQKYNAALHIDCDLILSEDEIRNGFSTLVVDVETTEGEGPDNFVGLALCKDDRNVYYYTALTSYVRHLLENNALVGHNVKFDLKQLVGWGLAVLPKQMSFDTCLASYVVNATRESHSLKDLARDILKMEWPTYKDMVGSGKAKTTLDKQPVERVARYCAMDALATYKLYQYFSRTMTPLQGRLLEGLELPVSRVLMEMELKGARIDVPYLKALDATFKLQIKQLEEQIQLMWAKATENKESLVPLEVSGKEFNINSNRQVASLLELQGAVLPTTKKGNKKVDKQTIKAFEQLPAVPLLLEYSKIEKLWSTYTQGLLARQRNGRIYCNFNQITRGEHGADVGITTGRLSSSNPNLQNIPARTEEGQMILKAFLPEPGYELLDADYSQIEPRILAHVSQEKFLLDVYRNDKDLYEELVRGTGRSRQDGKTFMLALLYGAQAKKLAAVFKCSEEEADDILAAMWKKLPGVRAWIERTKFQARQLRGVYTLQRRFIPLPLINEGNRFDRLHWERVAVNAVVQGSAAEIMKRALIMLKDNGYVPVLTVHDSGLFNINNDTDALKIKLIMESATTLDVPLKVDLGRGKTWAEAKL